MSARQFITIFLLAMSAELAHFISDVAPGVGRAAVVDVTGAVFVCKEATAPFEMAFDDRPKFPCEGGFILRPPDGFTRLAFFNLSASNALTVNCYAGNTFVDYQYLRTRGTRLKAGGQTLLPEATVTFPGIDSGNRRKSFHIDNDYQSSPAKFAFLDVGTTLAKVYGITHTQRNWYEIETDADITVINPNLVGSGISIPIYVAELFYTT